MLPGCSSPDLISVDSSCDTYGYVNLPEDMKAEAVRLIENGQREKVPQWQFDVMKNNRYYDDNCKESIF